MGWRRPLAFVPVVGLLAAAAPVWAQGAKPPSTPPAIVDSAGSGPIWPDGGGFSGDGGPASQAEIDHPSQAAPLPGGGYLFTDTSDRRARHVAAFSIHVLLPDGRGSALFRRVAHDRLLPDGP
jgi:hypothetical protein